MLAVTASGEEIWVTDVEANLVSVIRRFGRVPVDVVSLAGPSFGLAIVSDGTHVYVSSPSADVVSVIDAASKVVLRTVAIPEPLGLAVTPDGSAILVATGRANAVAFVDARTGRVDGRVSVAGRPRDIVVDGRGARAYVAHGTADVVSAIDLRTREVRAIAIGEPASGIAVSPDGARLYVGLPESGVVRAIDAVTHEVVATIEFPTTPQPFHAERAAPYALAIDPHDTAVYVTHRPSVVQLMGEVRTGPSIAGVSVISTDLLRVVDTIPLGFAIVDGYRVPRGMRNVAGADAGVAFDPSGKAAYVATPWAGIVWVVDTLSRKQSRTIPLRPGARID